MRDRLKAELGSVTHPEFLVYLMGPYTSFDVRELLPDHAAGVEVSFPSAKASERAIDEMLATLRRVQGHLRTAPGVNAFLAIDVGISLDEMDAATQSIRFARASNVIAFVVPRLGDNFGVGMEVGAVLEDRYPDSERVVVLHEKDVSSAMLGGVTRRWEARISSCRNEDELVTELRNFVVNVMYREATGALPRRNE